MRKEEFDMLIEGFEKSPIEITYDSRKRIGIVDVRLGNFVRFKDINNNSPFIVKYENIENIDFKDDACVNLLSNNNNEKKAFSLNIHIGKDCFEREESTFLVNFENVFDECKNEYGSSKLSTIIDIKNSLDYVKNKTHEFNIKNDKVIRAIDKMKQLVANGHILFKRLLLAVYFELGEENQYKPLLNDTICMNEAFWIYKGRSEEDRAASIALKLVAYHKASYDVIRWTAIYSKKFNKINLLYSIIKEYPEYKKDILFLWFNDIMLDKPLPKDDINNDENILYLERYFVEKYKPETIIIDINKIDIQDIEFLKAKKEDDSLYNEKYYIGKISYFEVDKKYGYISSDDCIEKNLYFYIKQVKDKELQKRLCNGQGINHKVTFKLGINFKGLIAADCVELLESNKKEEISQEVELVELEGIISDFSKLKELGRIQSGNKSYTFSINSVKSSSVKKDLEENIHIPTYEVSFAVEKNKQIALNIIKLDEKKTKNKENSKIKEMKIERFLYYEYEPLAKVHKEKIYSNDIIIDAVVANCDNNSSIDFLPNEDKNNKFVEIRNSANGSEKGNYDIAHRNLFAGRLEAAKEFYLKALHSNEKIEATVPDLNSIFMRLGDINSSIELLNAYEDVLQRKVYLNLMIASLHKSQKNKHLLIKLLVENVHRTSNITAKMHNIMALAKCYAEIGNFEKSLECFDEWEALSKRSHNSINTSVKTYFMKSKAVVLIKNGDKRGAEELAKSILKISPNDIIAQSILNNEDNISLDLEWDDSWNKSSKTQYITQKLNDVSLESENDLKGHIQGGKYVGSEKKALDAIINITKRRKTANNDDKSSHYFICAKLIDNLLANAKNNNNEIIRSEKINEQMLQLYMAIGMLYWGEVQFSTTDFDNHYDFTRFCYWQVTNIFDGQKTYACWLAAFTRYFETFFIDGFTSKTKMQGIDQESDVLDTCELEDIDNSFKYIRTLFKNKLKLQDSEFTKELLHFFLIGSNAVHMKRVISVLEDTPLKEKVQGFFKLFLGDNYKESMLENFEYGTKVWRERQAHFIKCLNDLSKDIFNNQNIENLCRNIKEHAFVQCLNFTELKYKDDIISIFKKISNYNEANYFEIKSSILNVVDNELDSLETAIISRPTHYSYEYFLEVVRRTKSEVIKEAGKLYEESKPVLDVSVKEHYASINDKNEIVIPLSICNKPNVQTAEDVSIEVYGKDCNFLDSIEHRGRVVKGDGKSIDLLLKCVPKNSNIDNQMVEFDVKIKYTYHTNLKKSISTEHTHYLTANLYGSEKFKPIDNKFKNFAGGSVVYDKDMFMGRKKDLDEIIQWTKDAKNNFSSGRSLALFGQTRTGKSSLLYHLKNRLKMEDYVHNIILDLGSIGSKKVQDNGEYSRDSVFIGILYSILRNLKYAIDEKVTPKLVRDLECVDLPSIGEYTHKELRDLLMSNEIIIDPNVIIQRPYEAALVFEDQFDSFCKAIESSESKYNIIIMIDEFTYIYDYIRKGEISDNILRFWKAFIQNPNIFAFVVGQDHMMQFVKESDYTNCFATMELRKVTYLEERYAYELMSAPIMYVNEDGVKIDRYKEGAKEKIYELTSGSAFLIMKFCSELVEYINEQKCIFITGAHVEDFLNKNIEKFEEAVYFDPQYNDKSNIDCKDISEKNKKILLYIAKKSKNREWADVSEFLKDKEKMNLINRLVDRDVLVRNNSNKFKIKVGLYKEFLIRMHGNEME